MKELGIKPGDKLQVQTYNWGPCVIRFKITEKFKKLLLEESNVSTV